MPRRTRAPSIRSSWTSVAMWTSSTAAPAATDGRAPAGAERNVSIGRSRLPPAVERLGADLGDEARVPGHRRVEELLDLVQVLGEARGGADDRRAWRSSRRRRVERDDRAAEEPEPAPSNPVSSISAARSSAPGKRRTLAGRYVYALPPGSTRPRSGTIRSNQSEKNGFSGPRGWVISRIASRPPGRRTRRSSSSAALEVGDVAHAEADRGRVEARRPSKGSASTSPCTHSIVSDLRRARTSISLEKSRPVTMPPSRSAAIARSPVPQQASRTRAPGWTTRLDGEPAPASGRARPS